MRGSCQGALVYRTFPMGHRRRVVFNDWRALLDAAFRRWKMESIYADVVNPERRQFSHSTWVRGNLVHLVLNDLLRAASL